MCRWYTIFITQPSKRVMLFLILEQINFSVKGQKVEMNLQAICDDELRFIDIDAFHPVSTFDCLAYCVSSILLNLEKDNFLKPEFCLYGDNTYVNRKYIAFLFMETSS